MSIVFLFIFKIVCSDHLNLESMAEKIQKNITNLLTNSDILQKTSQLEENRIVYPEVLKIHVDIESVELKNDSQLQDTAENTSSSLKDNIQNPIEEYDQIIKEIELLYIGFLQKKENCKSYKGLCISDILAIQVFQKKFTEFSIFFYGFYRLLDDVEFVKKYGDHFEQKTVTMKSLLCCLSEWSEKFFEDSAILDKFLILNQKIHNRIKNLQNLFMTTNPSPKSWKKELKEYDEFFTLNINQDYFKLESFEQELEKFISNKTLQYQQMISHLPQSIELLPSKNVRINDFISFILDCESFIKEYKRVLKFYTHLIYSQPYIPEIIFQNYSLQQVKLRTFSYYLFKLEEIISSLESESPSPAQTANLNIYQALLLEYKKDIKKQHIKFDFHDYFKLEKYRRKLLTKIPKENESKENYMLRIIHYMKAVETLIFGKDRILAIIDKYRDKINEYNYLNQKYEAVLSKTDFSRLLNELSKNLKILLESQGALDFDLNYFVSYSENNTFENYAKYHKSLDQVEVNIKNLKILKKKSSIIIDNFLKDQEISE